MSHLKTKRAYNTKTHLGGYLCCVYFCPYVFNFNRFQSNQARKIHCTIAKLVLECFILQVTVTLTLTFDLLTQKNISLSFSISSICVRSTSTKPEVSQLLFKKTRRRKRQLYVFISLYNRYTIECIYVT